MKVIGFLGASLFLVSTVVTPVFAQSLDVQLQRAVDTRNWQRAIGIVDRMIDANPQDARKLRAYRNQLQQLAAPTAAPATQPAPSTNSPLILDSWQATYTSSSTIQVRGIVTNGASQPIETFRVIAELYNSSGQRVSESISYIASLSPGTSTNFSIFAFSNNSNIASIRLRFQSSRTSATLNYLPRGTPTAIVPTPYRPAYTPDYNNNSGSYNRTSRPSCNGSSCTNATYGNPGYRNPNPTYTPPYTPSRSSDGCYVGTGPMRSNNGNFLLPC